MALTGCSSAENGKVICYQYRLNDMDAVNVQPSTVALLRSIGYKGSVADDTYNNRVNTSREILSQLREQREKAGSNYGTPQSMDFIGVCITSKDANDVAKGGTFSIYNTGSPYPSPKAVDKYVDITPPLSELPEGSMFRINLETGERTVVQINQ